MEYYLYENFGGLNAKRSSDEALQRWRILCANVKNPKRRFRFTANLAKRAEAAAIKRTNHRFSNDESIEDEIGGNNLQIPTPSPSSQPATLSLFRSILEVFMHALFSTMSYLMGIVRNMWAAIIVILCLGFEVTFTPRNLWLIDEGLGCIIEPALLGLLSRGTSIYMPEEDLKKYNSTMRFVFLYGWVSLAISFFYCALFRYRNYEFAAVVFFMLSKFPIIMVGYAVDGYFGCFTFMHVLFSTMSYLMGVRNMWAIIIVIICPGFEEIFTLRNLWLTDEGLGCIIAPALLGLLSMGTSIYIPEEDLKKYNNTMRFVLLYGWVSLAITFFYCAALFRYRNYDLAAAVIFMLSKFPIIMVGYVVDGYFGRFTDRFFRCN